MKLIKIKSDLLIEILNFRKNVKPRKIQRKKQEK